VTALLASDVDDRATEPRCGFGICRREPEHLILTHREDGSLEPVLAVCALHVTPAIAWGRPAPLEVAIRPI